MRGRKLSATERLKKIEVDKSERIKIFKEILAHVRLGFSIDCFGPMSENSIKSFLKLYPEEFIEEELAYAIRDAKGYWEGLGRSQSNGTCLGNSRSWYYNMSNRYGWSDRQQVETEHKGQVQVNVVNYASKKRSQDSTDQ